MRVITAPEEYECHENDVVCFLGGGISNCWNWQKEVIRLLKRAECNGTNLENLVILNPRRDNFDIKNKLEAEIQIAWENSYFELFDIFSMYLCDSESDQPICMYELGKYSMWISYEYDSNSERHMIVSMENGFKREFDVEEQLKYVFNFHENDIIIKNSNPTVHVASIIDKYCELNKERTEINNLFKKNE